MIANIILLVCNTSNNTNDTAIPIPNINKSRGLNILNINVPLLALAVIK